MYTLVLVLLTQFFKWIINKPQLTPHTRLPIHLIYRAQQKGVLTAGFKIDYAFVSFLLCTSTFIR